MKNKYKNNRKSQAIKKKIKQNKIIHIKLNKTKQFNKWIQFQ